MSLFRSIPDGPRAFSVAIAACLVQSTVFGIMNSFSVFTNNMEADASLGNPSQTDCSFVSSVSVGLAPAFGAFAGGLSDRIGARATCLVSISSLFCGLWLASMLAHSTVTLALTFGVPAAMASGFMLSPGAAATASWFHKHKTLGTGIAFAGGGLGSCIVPALCGSWADSYGWRVSFRLLSAFCAVGFIAAANVSFMKPSEVASETTVEIVNSSPVVRSRPMAPLHVRRLTLTEMLFQVFFTKRFAAHFLSFACFVWPFYAILYITVPYASSMGKQGTVYQDEPFTSTETASTLMTSFGVFQILFSLASGFIASKIGNKATHIACSIIGTLAYAYLIFCRTYAEFAVTLSALGIASSGIFAVVPSMIATDYHGPNMGSVMGVTFFASLIGGISASPTVSALEAANNGNYGYGVAIMAIAQGLCGLICALGIATTEATPGISDDAKASLLDGAVTPRLEVVATTNPDSLS